MTAPDTKAIRAQMEALKPCVSMLDALVNESGKSVVECVVAAYIVYAIMRGTKG